MRGPFGDKAYEFWSLAMELTFLLDINKLKVSDSKYLLMFESCFQSSHSSFKSIHSFS